MLIYAVTATNYENPIVIDFTERNKAVISYDIT